jgi:uncharacterized protein YkwD
MMLMRIIWILALTVSLITTENAMSAQNDRLAEDILIYINQFRVRHGLPKLQMNPLLTQEAEQHSADMAQHRVAFGHDGFEQRIAHLKKNIQTAQGGAENVAYNYKTAQIVAEGWIKSPGHRRNILGHYTQTGIGIVRDAQGRPYFTQLFLKA